MNTFPYPISEIESRLQPRLQDNSPCNYPLWIKNQFNSQTQRLIISFSWDANYMDVQYPSLRNIVIPDSEEQNQSQEELTIIRVVKGLTMIWQEGGYGLILIQLRRSRIAKRINEHSVEIRVSHHTSHPFCA